MAAEISEALSYLHARDVIHRDLKVILHPRFRLNGFFPKGENILLERSMEESELDPTDIEYRCKVADFGLATLFRESSDAVPTEEVGSVWWRAPEIFKKKYDKRCDYFSFGVLLIEIITRDLGEDIRTNMTCERKEKGELIFGVDSDLLKTKYNHHYTNGPTALFDLAISCCKENPDDRPDAREIVSQLSTLYDTYKNVKRIARQSIKCKKGVYVWMNMVIHQEKQSTLDLGTLCISTDLVLQTLVNDYKEKIEMNLSDDGVDYLKTTCKLSCLFNPNS